MLQVPEDLDYLYYLLRQHKAGRAHRLKHLGARWDALDAMQAWLDPSFYPTPDHCSHSFR